LAARTPAPPRNDKISADLASLAVPIGDLRLLDGNPRRGDVDAVKRSLERFGQRKPVVCKADGTVTAGNHTLKAALALGWSHLARVVEDDDDATALAWALADNRTAELGDYDDAELLAMIDEVGDVDLLVSASWGAEAIEALREALEADGVKNPIDTDPDDVPDSAPGVTVPGDVWLLGEHRVMCGDATDPMALERLLAGDLADVVWTDPPYGVAYVGKTADALTIVNDGDEYEAVLDGAFDSVLAGCRPGAAVYVAAPPGPRGVPFAVKLDARGLFRQRLAWVKDVFVLGHSDYHYRHEDIYFGYTPKDKGRLGRGGVGWYGDNAQDSVLEFDRPKRSSEHPTMKPVELVSYCLGNSSRRNDVVLDLFGGSGTTLIASHIIGRRARLMELDPRYVDVICLRFQLATGILPIAESTGREHDFTVEG
jgi:site-specific DNA-methyltransferase (adenine-specific)